MSAGRPAPSAGAQLHGSVVAAGGRAVLITGAAGAGKTTLALEMIALGAELVADDRVDTWPESAGPAGPGRLWLSAPAKISGLGGLPGFPYLGGRRCAAVVSLKSSASRGRWLIRTAA